MSVERTFYCRVCLRNRKEMYLLSDKSSDTKTHLVLLHECTGVLSQPSEHLCFTCAKKLVLIEAFICEARQSDAIIRRLQSKIKHDQTQQSNDSKDETTYIETKLKENFSMQVENVLLSENQMVNKNEYCIDIEDNVHETLCSSNTGLSHSEGAVEIEGISEVPLPDIDDNKHALGNISNANNLHSPDFDDKNISLLPESISDYAKRKVPNEKCDICGKLLLSKITLRKHMRLHNADTVKPATATCSICERVLSDKRSLTRHMLRHSKEKPQNPNIINTIEGKIAYACNVCGKALSSNQHLRRHMVMHTAGKTFLCTMCPSTFYYEFKLKEHMRRHTGERPYECEFCKKRFTDVSTLGCHVRCHTGERPYRCDICGKGFAQQTSMKSHRANRHEEKTVPCPHCDKKFVRQTDVTNHIRRIKNERKMYSCEFCSKSFFHKVRLIGHLKKFHPDQNDEAGND